MTENWLKYEEPKSPWRMPPTQSTYCSGIDLSRPSSALMLAIVSPSTSLIVPPSFVIVGSPGITRISRKTAIDPRISSPALVTSRLTK